ncbi:MAG: NAD-dependent epimerase, partial [Rhodothermaceae bacterium]|nr:NAD-dependent epimerase [Rhodothermaceae bacterium]
GKQNALSMREAFALAESVTGKPMQWSYDEANREGDHICYYSDLSRIQGDYPSWEITKDLRTTTEEIAESWARRLATAE